MKIEAICPYIDAGKGIKQPEYLVRMSHREAMSLGAKTFQAGEELTIVATVQELYGFSVSARILSDNLEKIAKGMEYGD